MSHELTRRRFLSTTLPAAALGAVTLGAPARALAGPPPSERLRLAWIGCGGRGRQLADIADAFADVDIVAISDVNAPRMEKLLEGLAASPRRQRPETASDHRRVLERKDIDAVVIATCEHWHATPFIEACQAGKHVYVEKPLSKTIREGALMVKAARAAGNVVLMGTQQRAGEHFQRAVTHVRSGRLGKIAHVECWNYHDIDRGGRPADRAPPASLDWDRWLGPAPEVPFNPLRLPYSWWFDYGGGMMTNWAVHHVDTILWAMGYPELESAQCMGGLLVTDTSSDAPDLVEASWQFPGWVLRYNYRGFSNHAVVPSRPNHHGILFAGTDASLVLDRHGYVIYENGEPLKPVETASRSEQDGPWQRHFVDCVKLGNEPAVSLEESHQSTLPCLLGNIAYHVGRTVRWDAATRTIRDDPKAAALLDPPRRKGYELPEV